jgi:hypothetical protein
MSRVLGLSLGAFRTSRMMQRLYTRYSCDLEIYRFRPPITSIAPTNIHVYLQLIFSVDDTNLRQQSEQAAVVKKSGTIVWRDEGRRRAQLRASETVDNIRKQELIRNRKLIRKTEAYQKTGAI